MSSLPYNKNSIYSFSRLIGTLKLKYLRTNISHLKPKKLYDKQTHKTSNCFLTNYWKRKYEIPEIKKRRKTTQVKKQGSRKKLRQKTKKKKKCKSDLKERIKNKIFLMHLYWPGSDIFPRTWKYAAQFFFEHQDTLLGKKNMYVCGYPILPAKYQF